MSREKQKNSVLGQNIKRIRDLTRLDQKKFAREIGYCVDSLSRAERGIEPTDRLLRAIGVRFGIEEQYLRLHDTVPYVRERLELTKDAQAEYDNTERIRVVYRIKQLPPKGAEKLLDAISKMLDVFEDNINI